MSFKFYTFMLLFKGFFELFFIIFFLLSKEVLFYGEERLIACCYLFLLFVGFFVGYEGVNNDLNSRAKAIKDELDLYYYSIINSLVNTKKFLSLSCNVFYTFLNLYKAIMNEFSFYFLFFYNNSQLKKFLISYNANMVLQLTNEFYLNVRSVIIKKHNPSVLLNKFLKDYFPSVESKNLQHSYVDALLTKHINLKSSSLAGVKSADVLPYYLGSNGLNSKISEFNYFNK